jgi:SAM-dependent methyltransferase
MCTERGEARLERGTVIQPVSTRLPASSAPPGGGANHSHLVAILKTELSHRLRSEDSRRPIRVLDAGCGRGQLLSILSSALAEAFPEREVELYGYDVSDHGVQLEADFVCDALQDLQRSEPHVPWQDRIVLIGEREPWPFPDEHFDAVVSNQVLEHVRDAEFFVSQVSRTLRPGGFSAHLFPLASTLLEAHALLPLVHWPKTHDMRRSVVRLMTLLRLGPFWRLPRNQRNLADFSTQIADYVLHFTTYRRAGDLVRIGNSQRLRTSFRYTREYYSRRLRRLLGMNQLDCYSVTRSAVVDLLALFVLKYVASVTLFLEKEQRYRGFGLQSLVPSAQVASVTAEPKPIQLKRNELRK